MRGNETPGRILTNFCTGVGVHDVITSANFYDCRLWGLSVVRGQILGFSIDSRRCPYNTLTLPCECVISRSIESKYWRHFFVQTFTKPVHVEAFAPVSLPPISYLRLNLYRRCWWRPVLLSTVQQHWWTRGKEGGNTPMAPIEILCTVAPYLLPRHYNINNKKPSYCWDSQPSVAIFRT